MPTLRSVGKGEVHFLQTRQNIVEAAFMLFAEKGTEFSISQIAAAVGIRKASFYAHFASKEELLRKIIEDEAANYFLEIKEGNRDLKSIYSSIIEYFAHDEARLSFWKRLLLFPPSNLMEDIAEEIRSLSRRRLEIIREILDEYVRDGRLPTQDTKKTAIELLSLIHGLLSSRMIYGFKDEDLKYEAIWEDFYRGIGGNNK